MGDFSLGRGERLRDDLITFFKTFRFFLDLIENIEEPDYLDFDKVFTSNQDFIQKNLSLV